jgi:hypothetical protein
MVNLAGLRELRNPPQPADAASLRNLAMVLQAK